MRQVIQNFFENNGIRDEIIAVGVSGGADSLALVWQLKNWAENNGRKIIALTVDHGLRPEAGQEAKYVASLMKSWGVEHHILVWEGPKPKANLEALAREARYDLIANWCHHHKIKVLAMGHHLQDQAETFLMRLSRGSGLYGLSGILPVSRNRGLTVIRPQLSQKPEDLRQMLREQGIEWKEDASNYDEEYLRARVRRYLPEFEQKFGLSRERLAATAIVLSRSRQLVEQMTEEIVARETEQWLDVIAMIKQENFQGWHPELLYHVLAKLISQCGLRPYVPEADEMLRLCEQIKKPQFKGCTLGNCEILLCRQKLWIFPEIKNKPLLKRQQWQKFVETHPGWAQKNFPYKVRQIIYCKLS